MKSAIAYMKNSLETFNSRFEQAEGRLSKLEDRFIRLSSLGDGKKKKKRTRKNEQNPRNLCDFRWPNMCMMGIIIMHFMYARRGQEKEAKTICEEIMVKNFPNLMKDTSLQPNSSINSK